MKELTAHLSEGKKQALKIKGATSKMVDMIAKYDPTSTNKYTYILTKFWVSKDLEDYDLMNVLPNLITQAEKKGYSADINGFETLEDLMKSLRLAVSKISRRDRKKGLEGITQGKDYEILYEADTWTAYMPFSYEASVVFGSDKLGGCEGKWCIASNRGSATWDSYIRQGSIFVVMINQAPKIDPYWVKVAIQVPRQGTEASTVWNRNDAAFNLSFLTERVTGFDTRVWRKIKKDAQELAERYLSRSLPEWLLQAKTLDMKVVQTNLGKVVWQDGRWVNGIWEFGTWKDGTWWKGIWKNGVWEDGTWEDGIWERGTWQNGLWEFGTWYNGTWKDGTWRYGIWEDGTWEKGIWYNGTWYNGTWEDGTWEGGTWENGVWEFGTWEFGTWEDGKWKKGTWENGTWESGEWEFGTWKGGTWEEGDIWCKKHRGKILKVTIDPSKFYELEEKSESWDEFLEILEDSNYLKEVVT